MFQVLRQTTANHALTNKRIAVDNEGSHLRQAHRAVRLFGVAAARREQIGFPVDPVDRPDYDRDVAAAHAQLFPGEWDAGWPEGKAMTLEQALAYALEEINAE